MAHTMKEKSKTMATASRSSRKGRDRGLAAGAALGCLSLVFGLSTVAGGPPSTGGGGVASGSVATISGNTMQVQSTTSQTAVTWTPTTAFSETATETVSAIAVGDCLTVTGTPSKKSKTTIAARSITINKASSTGTCTSGFGGAAGSAAGGFGGAGRFGAGGRPGAGAGGSGSGETPPSGSFPSRSGGSARGGFPGAANFSPRHGQGDGGQWLDAHDLGDALEPTVQSFVHLEVDEADEAQDAEAQDHDGEFDDTVGDPGHDGFGGGGG